MDFGDFPPLKNPAAYISADLILYRGSVGPRGLGEDIEILVSKRNIEPWKGCWTVCAGGYLDPSDENLMIAALRETSEEVQVNACIDFLVGIYGPERYHHAFNARNRCLEKTEQPANNRPTVTVVFAGRIVDGTPADTDELSQFVWIRLSDLRDGRTFAFDHALFLHTFQYRLAFFHRNRDVIRKSLIFFELPSQTSRAIK